jgi:hypothetical protein
MRRRLAPALAFLFLTTACALVVADAYAPGLAKYAIGALALSNAALLWAYMDLLGARAPHRRRAARRIGRRAR